LSPWVDLTVCAASFDSVAAVDPQGDRWRLAELADLYLAGADPRERFASPLFADLTGISPLLIQVGGAEKLLDDSVGLGEAAHAAGVSVTLQCWENMLHVWHSFAPRMPEAVAAIDSVAQWLQPRWGAHHVID
jgi:monoterpene epsilon-lactone hydrolase